MAISDYSTTRDSNADITPGNIRSNDFRRDQQIINAIRQLMADLASHVGTTAEFNIVRFSSTTGAIQSGSSSVNFDQIWHDDTTNTWYIVSDGAANRETTNTTGTLNVGGLRLTRFSDLSLSSTDHPFQIGSSTSTNIAADDNEMMARNNGAASDFHINAEGGDVRINANSGGGLTFRGGQITFPATQNPSTNANTLDDYEEGTWTPTLSFGGATTGITYNSNEGIYIKIGQLVNAFYRIRLSSKGTATGAALIAGLPFAVSNIVSFGGYYTGIAAFYAGMSGLNSHPAGYANRGNTTINLTDSSATARVNLVDTNFTDTSDIIMSITYRATA